jgi:uncharacterized protein (DUF2147 family)
MRKVISWRRRSDGDSALHVGKAGCDRLRPSQSLLKKKKLTGDDMTLTSFHRMLTAVGLLVAPASSLAEDAQGVWLVEERDAHVRIAPCGGDLCGWITWLKHSSGLAKTGQRVLWDMRAQSDGAWKGQAFNPRDGNTYSGRMKVSGDILRMTGCVFGGVICKTASWARIK